MLDSRTTRPRLAAILAMASAIGLAPATAPAIDFSWSGFATLGLSRSDTEYRYLRWIDEDGSFRNETVGGLQLDAQLSPRWSATLQLRVAPADDDDSRWELEPSWGFLAWRPADGWLLRAGKFRLPFYLYSEVLDVGVAHDMARLPVEIYALSPANELVGGSVAYDWTLDDMGDYLLNAMIYGGGAEITTRGWQPVGIPGFLPAGAMFQDADARAYGLVLDLAMPDTRLRAAVLRARGRPEVTAPKYFPRVDLAPGLSFYKVDPRFPGPPLEMQNVVHNTAFTLGLDRHFVDGWRVTAEYARIIQHDTDVGTDSHSGYVALFKQWKRFTPYLSYSRLTSTEDQLEIYRNLVDTTLPPGALGGAEALLNGAQRAVAALSYASDQQSFAIGSSVEVPGGKLKFEWAHTWVDETSRLIDEGPRDPLIGDRDFNVWTLNYSVAF